MEENIQNRRRAQQLRKNQTKEERHLWYDFLKNFPVQFKRQYPIGVYYVDFYCYRAKLIVELDGSQHCTEEAIGYDLQRTAYLEAHGFKVLRISNLDIWKNFCGVCEQIRIEVEKRVL